MPMAYIIKPHQMWSEFFIFPFSTLSLSKKRGKTAPTSLIFMNYRSEGHDNVKMTQVGNACSKKNALGTIATTSLQIGVVLQRQPPNKLT